MKELETMKGLDLKVEELEERIAPVGLGVILPIPACIAMDNAGVTLPSQAPVFCFPIAR